MPRRLPRWIVRAGTYSLKAQLPWSVKVNGNWRITFRFENGDAFIVDYRDYH